MIERPRFVSLPPEHHRYVRGVNATQREPFVSLLTAAQSLGVPAAWPKRESSAGRLPMGVRPTFAAALLDANRMGTALAAAGCLA